MIFPANSRVHKIPQNIDPFKAAFVEPLACSVHGVNLAELQFNDVIVIAGCGPIGLGMIAAAKMKNPKWIIALGRIKPKLNTKNIMLKITLCRFEYYLISHLPLKYTILNRFGQN